MQNQGRPYFTYIHTPTGGISTVINEPGARSTRKADKWPAYMCYYLILENNKTKTKRYTSMFKVNIHDLVFTVLCYHTTCSHHISTVCLGLPIYPSLFSLGSESGELFPAINVCMWHWHARYVIFLTLCVLLVKDRVQYHPRVIITNHNTLNLRQ